MEREAVIKEQHRRNLVADDFRRMIVTSIEQAHQAVLGRVVHIELMRTNRVRLDADAEDLALDAVCNVLAVILHGENLIERILQTGARADTVSRNILRAIGNPDIVERRDAELLAEEIRNLAARLAVRTALSGQALRPCMRCLKMLSRAVVACRGQVPRCLYRSNPTAS